MGQESTPMDSVVREARERGREGYPPDIALVVHPVFHRFYQNPLLVGSVDIKGVYAGNNLNMHDSIGSKIWEDLWNKIQDRKKVEISAAIEEEQPGSSKIRRKMIAYDPKVRQALTQGINVIYLRPSSAEDEKVETQYSPGPPRDLPTRVVDALNQDQPPEEWDKITTQAPAPMVIVKGLFREEEDAGIFSSIAHQESPYTYFPQDVFPVDIRPVNFSSSPPELGAGDRLFAVCSDKITQPSELARYTPTPPETAGANPARLIEMEIRIPSTCIGKERKAAENRLVLSGLRAVSETLRLQTARAWERRTEQTGLNKILRLGLSDLQTRLFSLPWEKPREFKRYLSGLNISCNRHEFRKAIYAPNINTQITGNAEHLLGLVYPGDTYFGFPYHSTFVLLAPPVNPGNRLAIPLQRGHVLETQIGQRPAAFICGHRGDTIHKFTDDNPVLISPGGGVTKSLSTDGKGTLGELLRTLITNYKVSLTGNPPMIVDFKRDGDGYKADSSYLLGRNADIIDIISKLIP